MSNNPVSFTGPDGGWDGDSGMTDDFGQSMQGTVDWMRMTPAERRDYQAANGTDYAGQFRDKVFDMAFVGGYEDQDGNNWYYSARKNDIGAWTKMNLSNDPFGYYKIASDDGQFKMAASWLNYTERFVSLGYNGEIERMKWAQKTYGGTGDESILDQLHQSFSFFNTKWNPWAHAVNGIDGVVFGTDRFGNEQSGIQTTTQLASGIVGIFGTSIASGIAGTIVGEGMPTATKLSELGIKELQELTRMYSTEINAFFKSGGSQVASREGLEAYRELATRMLNNTGGAYQRVTEAAAKLHTQRIEVINQALKSLK